MTLLGIDVGTSGCKSAVFSERGDLLSVAYEEYDMERPHPGWAQLDSVDVWEKIKGTIRGAVAAAAGKAGPVKALAVSSMGEAVVPVTRDRRILGPSILNFDVRGARYLPALADALPDAELYRLNGNTLGNHYSLPKLKWIKENQPDLYESADYLLHWAGFVSFMLGADPVLDYALANRSLLFDVDEQDWSDRLLAWGELDRAKLPALCQAGTPVGQVAPAVADELGLPAGALIAMGTHDQCANAVGCGAITAGRAMYGMGTFVCLTPVFDQRPDPARMISLGLNTEHHAVPGSYVSFIFNHGGSVLKWYRDTFASLDRKAAAREGRDIYAELIAEMPSGVSSILALPHFAPTGPPEFVDDSSGVLIGLKLATARGDILKGLLEGITMYEREVLDGLPAAGIPVDSCRAVGGGSKSDAWLQLTADIFGIPVVRPAVTEAGVLGAATIAGVGAGVWPSYGEAVEQMVTLDRTFEPRPAVHADYEPQYEKYRQIWPLMKGYLRSL
jgi:xylulokinase